MRYAYFPGCSLSSTAEEYDISTRLVCRALGVELVEIPDWICCGASAAHMTDRLLSLALPIKTLAWAEKEGLELVAPCAACFGRLKQANLAVRDTPRLLREVNALVGEDYKAQVHVWHPLEVIVHRVGLETVRERVKRPLDGLSIVPYYGCLLNRPKGMAEYDDPENPTSMDDLLEALGATVPYWSYKMECCGASLSLTHTEIVLKLSGDILREAQEVGADGIAVACPMCHSNLDMRQREIEKRRERAFGLPVLYFTQLLGLALGFNAEELALDRHFVSPREMLRKVA